ncbi:actin-related protein 2/3 complex subunit 5 [Orussus abietinus]|uniref:actin-related protein 2/3 complex subunit 5 n=1 Tax=Orussus abietinus TaxID=222816 RepID=UPI0006258716|nr:actin-related protein 2/3 complex subunit 5 [Orussus abietinus]
MSRNKEKKDAGSAFRKIDVDQYNENNFKEEEPDAGPTGPDEHEIQTLLNQGKNAEALAYVLATAPLGCKNQLVKDSARNLTQKVLLSIKSNQMDECLVQLDRDLIDVLMKYIYRGFEIPIEGSSAHLLIWHEKVYNIAGLGSIVRVLSDSKRA